ncbi:hypothetical protein [Microbacterium sp. NPDC080220]|uniref:hypothetical protein n=1 Tax=Microbacterium sp. NPDC080220 TaxID=3161017 RepID=UPI0034304071
MNAVVGGWKVWSWGERAGVIVLAASVLLLVWAAFQYGGGQDVAFFALRCARRGHHRARRPGRVARSPVPPAVAPAPALTLSAGR